jgi:hypothetical protein
VIGVDGNVVVVVVVVVAVVVVVTFDRSQNKTNLRKTRERVIECFFAPYCGHVIAFLRVRKFNVSLFSETEENLHVLLATFLNCSLQKNIIIISQ